MTTTTTPTEVSTYRWSSNDPADRFAVEDPATGEVITIVQGGGPAQVNAAVEAAHRAFQDNWRWRTPAERAALLLQCADVLEAHADELALLLSSENGKPFLDARQNDVDFLVFIFRFFGSLVDKLPTDFYDKGAIYTSTYHEPVGVVGEIIPFNWPPIHAGGKMAPALAAGNTVVIKPSEQDPLTVLRIVELLNTVLPEDVLHVLPGTGSRVGQPLVAHPLVRTVTFTGSTAAGAAVAATAAKNITPALMELGGKDAMVVFDDADFGRALKDAVEGGFYNKGEACTATSRILVQDGIYDRFVERLAAAVLKLRVGRGTDRAVHVGPVVSRLQQERVLNYIQVGIDEGATLAAQAPLPGDPPFANGFWVAPTLFTDVTRDMRIVTEEIFGPVVTVTRFSDEDEAVAIVNESEYGLTSAIYTSDTTRGFRVARRRRTAGWAQGPPCARAGRDQTGVTPLVPRERYQSGRQRNVDPNQQGHTIATDAHPWSPVQTIATLAVGAIILVIFVLIEARYARSPIVLLKTFRRRSLSIANVISTTVGAGVFGMYFFMSLYLQEVKGYSPLRAGMAFLPIGLATSAAARVAGRLVLHLGVRRQLLLAPFLSFGGALWLSQVTPVTNYFPGLFVPLLVSGIGIGSAFVPLTLAATAGVPPSESGLASGLLNTSRQMGGAIGLAVLATGAASASRHELGQGGALADALTHGYSLAFLIIAAIFAAGALTASFLERDEPASAPGSIEGEPVALE